MPLCQRFWKVHREPERGDVPPHPRTPPLLAKSNGVYTGRKSIERVGFSATASEWQQGRITAVEATRRLDMSSSTFYRKVKEVKL